MTVVTDIVPQKIDIKAAWLQIQVQVLLMFCDKMQHSRTFVI